MLAISIMSAKKLHDILTTTQIFGLATFAYAFSYLVLNPNRMLADPPSANIRHCLCET
jgi:hypothetical protein